MSFSLICAEWMILGFHGQMKLCQCSVSEDVNYAPSLQSQMPESKRPSINKIGNRLNTIVDDIMCFGVYTPITSSF